MYLLLEIKDSYRKTMTSSDKCTRGDFLRCRASSLSRLTGRALSVVRRQSLLSFVPGGRDNAVFIQKRAFETLATRVQDGSYYSRPASR